MTLKTLMLALGVAALAAAPGLAVAAHTDGGWHHQGMDMLRGVDLTDAQKQQIHQIQKSDMDQFKGAGQRLHALHEQMSAAMLSGASIDQLLPIQHQEDTLREQMDSQRLALAVQVRNVLTPEQLSLASAQHAKLVALHQQEHAVMDSARSQ